MLKIERIDLKPTRFENLVTHDIFEWNNEIYMKTNLFRDCVENENFNAVSLKSGDFAFLLNEFKVIELDGKLIVKNKVKHEVTTN